MNPDQPYILLDDQITPHVRLYENPVEIITASDPGDIETAFERLADHHKAGRYLAGYFSYELGYALEDRLAPLMPDNRPTPLLQVGVFEGYQTQVHWPANPPPNIALSPDWTQEEYTERFDRVIDYLKAGDVYQINLTFPMRGEFVGKAFDLYTALRDRQPGKYGGVVSLGGPDIISLSPELFFKKTERDMFMRPMKGTLPRREVASAMQSDIKSRAENLMIVDLLRNDLSRISEPGSVTVPELFALETYPTLHQMTSQIRSRLTDGSSLRSIIQSLFPSGSITGAPKIRAMEIIRELESSARGAYCGSLGYIDPGRDMCFNVGIRTITLSGSKLTYNVGSGVVLDSRAESEYAECLLKAKVLERPAPQLIETMRWDPNEGFIRGDLHMNRLQTSAEALGYVHDMDVILSELAAAMQNNIAPMRVRMALAENGQIAITTSEFAPLPSPVTLCLSKNPLTPDVQETRYKTDARVFYDGERERVQTIKPCDEVIFVNAEGQLCEGSFTSLFIKKDEQLLTPKLSCGLLPGILREALLASGEAVEAVLTLDDLKSGDTIYVGNSLRGLIEAKLISLDLY